MSWRGVCHSNGERTGYGVVRRPGAVEVCASWHVTRRALRIAVTGTDA